MVDISALLRLDGKVALVTGGSKGIGLSVAQHFIAAGASVMLLARGEAGLGVAVKDLRLDGGRVVGMAADAMDSAVPESAASRCVNELGGLDILVNNAGSQGPVGPLIECDPEAVTRVVHDDQLAPLRWSQAAYRAWMQEHGGSIINITSFAGIRARPGYGAYGHAKGALDIQTRYLAAELAPGVRVNSVAPGLVMTEMVMNGTTEAYRDTAARDRPMKRLGEAGDIAKAVLFLCSDAASWITGQLLAVEGGATLNT
jgi:NAD(P)-dependent dehydrogenase (short-subunit alcohol dehydrogenase family)